MAGAQLRCYRIVAGGLDDFVALFHEQLVPLRAQYGFRVHGPWVDRAANRFVWVAENVGAGTYPEAEAAYYAAPERAAVAPAVVALIAEVVEARLVDPAPPPSAGAR